MMEKNEQVDWPLAVWKAKYLITLAGVVCALAGLVASFVVPKTYQSGLVLKVGRVSYVSTNFKSTNREVVTEDIETVAAIQDLIKSEPFMAEVISRLKLDTTPSKLLKKVKVSINLDAKQEEQNNQVIITVKSDSQKSAVSLAEAIANLIIERHSKLYQQAMAVQNSYKEKLGSQISSLNEELSYMKATLKGLYKSPKVETPAVLLLQASIEGKEEHLTDLKRELSQVMTVGGTNLKSENTSVVVPPYTPSVPVSPNQKLVVLAGFFVGIASAAIYVAYRESGPRTGA